MNGLDHINFKHAGELLTKLKYVHGLQSLMRYSADTLDITAVTVSILGGDECLMDISTDVEGSPFSVDELLAFCNQMLSENEQKLIGDLKQLGVNVGPHSPAPDAPSVERLKPKDKERAA